MGALPWAFAKAIWLCVSIGASLWAVMALARMAQRWTLAVSAFLLAFAPLHTGIMEGQPCVLVCALIVISIVTPQPYIAGLLLGIAVCIKPQLALGFCFLALALNQGRKLIAACTTGLVLSGALAMILLGVALEFGQKLVPGRGFEVRDMFINGFGVLTGIAIGILGRRIVPAVSSS